LAVRQSESRHRDAPLVESGSDGKVDVDPTRFGLLQGKVHRGNLYRDGRFQASGVPVDPKVKWRFATGGPVKSSPVAVDGVVVVGSHDGHVYAIAAASGTEVWRHPTGARVSGSAAVVDGVVYIASEDGCLYALAAKNGKQLSKTRCGQAMAGSPAVAYGAVFIGAGNGGGNDRLSMTAGPVVALDAASGDVIWRSEPGPQGAAAVAADGRRLAVGLNGSTYGALDMRDGRGLFNVRAGHQARQAASLTFAADKIFVPAAMRGSVLCIGPQNRPLWQTATLPQNDELEVNNGGIPGYEILGDLAVTDDLVLAGCNDGKLYAFSAEQGQRKWVFATNGPVQSSPSVAGQTVYFGSWDGHVYAVNLSDGTLRWKLKLGDIPQTPAEQYKFGADELCGRIVGSPWPGDGVLYVGCDDGKVYAIE
jgi:outer membrane protein assembly factor BamB